MALKRPNIAILISGRGSNMRSLVLASQQERLGATVALVMSNREEALGLQIAQELGVCTQYLPWQSDRQAWEEHAVALLQQHKVNMLALAGFDRLLSGAFLDRFPRGVVNIHPSLLPQFPGRHAVAQALAANTKQTGCTVHLVDAGMDTGPILAAQPVPVLPTDTEESLSRRILQAEHLLYPFALQGWLQGAIIPQPQWGG